MIRYLIAALATCTFILSLGIITLWGWGVWNLGPSTQSDVTANIPAKKSQVSHSSAQRPSRVAIQKQRTSNALQSSTKSQDNPSPIESRRNRTHTDSSTPKITRRDRAIASKFFYASQGLARIPTGPQGQVEGVFSIEIARGKNLTWIRSQEEKLRTQGLETFVTKDSSNPSPKNPHFSLRTGIFTSFRSAEESSTHINQKYELNAQPISVH